MKKRHLILFIIFFLIWIVVAQWATHYVHTQYSVDNWEIRWWWSTTYSSNLNSAISIWNDYGDINIAPDTIFTYEDLKFSDISNSSERWYGKFFPDSFWTDDIKFNKYYSNSLTNIWKTSMITHEIGHSLGLLHSVSWNFMKAEWEFSRTSLGSQDKSDYDYLWSN